MTKERAGSWLLKPLSNTSGQWLLHRLIHVIAPVYFFGDRATRNGILALYRHLGLAPGKRLAAAYENYVWFSLSLLDKLARSKGTHPLVEKEYVAPSLMGKTTGAIMIGAHFGDWSFCGALFSQKKTQVAVVLNPQFSVNFNATAQGLAGLNVIDASRSGLEILLDIKKVLDDQGIVCFLGDRHGNEARIETVAFLGETAPFPLIPFELAQRLQVPIYDFYCIRQSRAQAGHYKLRVNEIWAPGTESRQTPSDLLAQYVKNLEQHVRDAPYHWFNFFDFWAQKPH